MVKEDNKTLVSVIIPSYNCGKFLFEAYESVLKQTYRDIEIIIVDDNSTDPESSEILTSIEKQGKARVFYLDKNHGVAYVRNLAIKNSKGKYILPLDCDDKIHEQYLEKATSILEKNDEIKIVYPDVIIFGKYDDFWNLPDFDLKKLLIKNYIHNSSVFRKSDFDKTNGYDEELKGLEDWDLWISILETTRGKAFHLPEKLFYYRIRENSRQQNLNRNPEDLEHIRKQIVYKHLKFYSEILGDPRVLYIENQKLKQKIARIENSFRYKLINAIFKPYDLVKKLLR